MAHDLKTPSKSAIYIAPENLSTDSNLGQLFIIAEINSKEKKVPAMLDQTIKEMSEYYYHSPTKNAEAALETACQYFNENISDIINKNTKWIRDKFNILAITIQENQLILSAFGDIQIWLFRKGKMHNIAANHSEKKKTASKKLLSSLVSGQLENEDALMLTTKTIFDYFADSKIRQTIATLAPTQACAFFKNTVLDYKIPIDFNTVIIKFTAAKKIAQNEKIQAASILSENQSGDTLNFTQKKSALKSVIAGAKKSSLKVTSLVRSSIQRIKDKKNTIQTAEFGKAPLKKTRIAPDEIQDAQPEKISKFSLSKHRLKIAITLIALLFIASLFMVNQKKEKQAELVNTQEIIKNINDKINSSEAALIYKDEAQAQKILDQAKNLLASLPQKTDEQRYEHQKLAETINQRINQIYHITPIENPKQIISLEELIGISSNILAAKNSLYFASGKAIYKINPEEKTKTKVADISSQIHKIINFDKNNLLLYNNQNKIFIFDTTNNTSRSLSFELPKDTSSIQTVALYSKKLYAADNVNNQIYKYTYSASGFANPTSWLKEEAEISNIQSISVDGNIWIASDNGQILKFFKGKKEVFSLSGVFEQITGNTKILTDENLSNLYILDIENNKIIIANKQGGVTKNLIGENIGKILSVYPNSDENLLYIMTEKNIFEIEI